MTDVVLKEALLGRFIIRGLVFLGGLLIVIWELCWGGMIVPDAAAFSCCIPVELLDLQKAYKCYEFDIQELRMYWLRT